MHPFVMTEGSVPSSTTLRLFYSNKQENNKFREKEKRWNSISEGGFVHRGTLSLCHLDVSTQLCQTLISPYDAHICVGGTVCRWQTHNGEAEAANVLMNTNCPTVQTSEFYSSKCLKTPTMAEIILIIITSCKFFITNITSDLTHTENVYFPEDYLKHYF